jgi:parallel beta-helix repeat protein
MAPLRGVRGPADHNGAMRRESGRAGARLVGIFALLALVAAGCGDDNAGGDFSSTTAGVVLGSPDGDWIVTTSTSTTSTSTTTTSTTTTTTTIPTADAVRVAPDGSGDAPDLASALAMVESGGTILLDAGEYLLAGPLVIDRAVVIRGSGSGQTTVAGTEPPDLLRFAGPGTLTLEGISFRYRGTAGADCLVVEGGTISFNDVLVAGAINDGETGGTGLLVVGDTDGTVNGATARGNDGHGFEFRGTAAVQVTASDASANHRSGFAWSGQAGGVVTGSTAEGNGLNGFQVGEGAAPDLTGNQALNNTEGGFRWSETAAGAAEGNTARGNGFSGFIALNRARPTLTDNQAEENEDDGFLFKGTSRATVSGNRAVANAWAGFRWVEQASGTAQGNTALENADGFWVADEADPTLIGNIARGHHNDAGNGSGFVYSGTAGGAARSNEIFDNDWGVALGTGADPTLTGNDVHDNTSNQVTDVTFG